MKNTMTMNEISAIATAKVNEFIEKGYVFNFGTMAGSQGDKFYADLVKGNITYRVRVYEKYEGCCDTRLVLEVRRIERKFVESFMSGTIWNSDGEVVESYSWYLIKNGNCHAYTDDIEFLEETRRIRKERRMNRRYNKVSVISAERILERVRSHRGYKRAKASDIECVYRTFEGFDDDSHAVYVVEFKNCVSKAAKLHLVLNQ